jgi:protein gp37
MADKSAIEWTDATWNPVRGCSRITTGCGGPNHEGGCYAEKIAARFSDPGQPFHGFAERTPHGGRWTGKLALIEDQLTLPLRWKKPRKIFVNSMSDLFHENLSDADIDRVFAVMALCPQHTFQVLTKRAERMLDYCTDHDDGLGHIGTVNRVWDIADTMMQALELPDDHPCQRYTQLAKHEVPWPLPNVWLGVSAERQEEAWERVPHLLQTPAAVRFVSAEPLLGPINFAKLGDATMTLNAFNGSALHLLGMRYKTLGGLDWIIVGGESGPRARPMHPQWSRDIRDQCAEAGVPFFFKQWGEWLPWHHFVTSGIEDGDPADATRFPTMQWSEDGWSDEGHPSWIDSADGSIDDMQCVGRVGKKAAGRLLDGREHNEFPVTESRADAA